MKAKTSLAKDVQERIEMRRGRCEVFDRNLSSNIDNTFLGEISELMGEKVLWEVQIALESKAVKSWGYRPLTMALFLVANPLEKQI
jgi:hypothetical protein